MEGCCVVEYTSHEGGRELQFFQSKKDAEKSVLEEMDIVAHELANQGYAQIEIQKGSEKYEIYVPNTNIYYEWNIFCSYRG